MVPHDSPFYTVASGAFGTYYVRVRQQYDFSNLVTDASKSFDFYAFSQPPEGVVTDLYANSTVMGVANSSQVANQYRHYLIAPDQTVIVTLTGIYGKGYPKLMVKISGVQTQISAKNVLSYDFEQSIDASTQSISMTLDYDMRMSVDPTCEMAGYANQTGGNPACGIYIAV